MNRWSTQSTAGIFSPRQNAELIRLSEHGNFSSQKHRAQGDVLKKKGHTGSIWSWKFHLAPIWEPVHSPLDVVSPLGPHRLQSRQTSDTVTKQLVKQYWRPKEKSKGLTWECKRKNKNSYKNIKDVFTEDVEIWSRSWRVEKERVTAIHLDSCPWPSWH